VDNKVICAPTIQATISSKALITGNFSQVEARRIALGIRPRKESNAGKSRVEFQIAYSQDTRYPGTAEAAFRWRKNQILFGETKLSLDPSKKLTDEIISHTSVEIDKSGKPRIKIDFTKAGTKAVKEMMKKGPSEISLVIIVDDKVISAPRYTGPPSNVYITGDFSKEEAEQIALGITTRKESKVELSDSLAGVRGMVRLSYGIAVPKLKIAEDEEVISSPQTTDSARDASETVRMASFYYKIGDLAYKNLKLPWLPSEFIANTRVIPDRANTPAIEVEFTKAGAKRMAEMTSKHARHLGAFGDTGEPTWTTNLPDVVSSGAIITGNFSNDEALQIAARIAGRDESKVSKVSAGSPIEFRVAYTPEMSPGGARVVDIPFKNKRLYLDTTAKLTSEIVSTVKAAADEATNKPIILIEFTKDGAAKMIEFTKRHLGKKLAILVDGKVISAPTMQSPISSMAVITGNFSKEEAERIVDGILVATAKSKGKDPEETGSMVIDVKNVDVVALAKRLNQQFSDQFTIKADKKNSRILFDAPYSTPAARVIEVIKLIEQLDAAAESDQRIGEDPEPRKVSKIEFRLAVDPNFGEEVPEGWEEMTVDWKHIREISRPSDGTTIFVDKSQSLSNEIVDSTSVHFLHSDPEIEVKYTYDGVKKLAAMTAHEAGKQLAIIIDGQAVGMNYLNGQPVKSTLLVTKSLDKAVQIANGIAPSSQPMLKVSEIPTATRMPLDWASAASIGINSQATSSRRDCGFPIRFSIRSSLHTIATRFGRRSFSPYRSA